MSDPKPNFSMFKAIDMLKKKKRKDERDVVNTAPKGARGKTIKQITRKKSK
jgi:hypothetical protein